MAFDIKMVGLRVSNKKDLVYTRLCFERNLHLETVDRDVYNLLDWIGEMGGFQRGLRTIFAVFLLALTYNNYESYMV